MVEIMEDKLTIRIYREEDTIQIVELMHRNFRQVNCKDYTPEEVEHLVEANGEEKVRQVGSHAHFYVACMDHTVVGCGAITAPWDTPGESIILSVFTDPRLHHHGIGKAIIETLEDDEYFLITGLTRLSASITASRFYEKMGYTYTGENREININKAYAMEKRHQKFSMETDR